MIKIKNRQDGGLKQELKPSKMCSVHPDKPVCARGLCKNCYDKWLKQNNPEYLERQRKNCDDWSKNHKEEKKKIQKDWVAKRDKDYNRIKSLRKYGLTIDDYNFMLAQQGGGCAICGKSPKEGKRLHIDHDHANGLIRGLLCFRCNFGLTYFAEDFNILFKASEYIHTSCQRGTDLAEALDKRIEGRNAEKEMQLKTIQNIIKSSKTRFIQPDDLAIMNNMCLNNNTLTEIRKNFPQYSRSAICRAIKKIIEEKK